MPRRRSDTAGPAYRPVDALRSLAHRGGRHPRVAPDADEQAIKRAYREAVKEKHPDRGGDEEEFKDVTAAYDRLTE
ncbi:J domain-containing protein [Halosegnis longus]|uniref:J domain-containing protein n=1 Tax=Halosegnis longus TaxID=2216012 RepID=A0AAJ4RAW9_9EURY|nr:J domain-containing protein [Salella cibi]